MLSCSAGGARIERITVGVTNATILAAAGAARLVGIDCPLGWPAPFADFLAAHRIGEVPPGAGADGATRRVLAFRRTDAVVRERTGRGPLSVAADRIAHPAMRCAGLQAELRAAGHPVRRSGIGSVVAEVYPAAALRLWGVSAAGRKSDPVALGVLVDGLRTAAPWLDWADADATCRRSHDAFDAVVCALVAAAVVRGRTAPPPAGQVELADEEGWIHLPDADFLRAPWRHPAVDQPVADLRRAGEGPEVVDQQGRRRSVTRRRSGSG